MDPILFRCADCGYRANVLGTSASDNEVKRRTMVCRPCRAVIDAVVARLVPGETEMGLPIDRWHAVAALCPHCQAGGLLPWPATHPCPRCDCEMDES
jgi:hypothetical protein